MMHVAIFDVDGTLLDNRNQAVYASTLSAIEELRKNGVTIVIATGRDHHRLIEGVLGFVPDYVVACSGHVLVDCDGRYIFKKPFDPNLVASFSDLIDRMQLPFTYKTAAGRFCNDFFPSDLRERVNREKYVVEELLYDRTKPYLSQEVFFAAGLASKEQAQTIAAAFDELSVYHMMTGWVDITYKGVDKALTIEMLLKELACSWNECIAFGDGLNDISFLEKAGIGVCMGNGYEKTKKIADYVCDFIDKDGIYKILKQLTII